MIDDPSDSGTHFKRGAGASSNFSQKAQEFMDRSSQAMGANAQRMRAMGQEYGEKARDQVRAKPLAAVGAAVAIGLIVSKLFMR